MKKTIAVFFIFIASISLSHADNYYDPADTTLYSQCIENSDGSTSSLRECDDAESDRLDKILNKSYKRIMNSNISSQEKEKIRNMQRTWLSYRKQYIDILTQYVTDGTLGPLTIDINYTSILRSQAIQILKLEKEIFD